MHFTFMPTDTIIKMMNVFENTRIFSRKHDRQNTDITDVSRWGILIGLGTWTNQRSPSVSHHVGQKVHQQNRTHRETVIKIKIIKKLC